jgi:hypothetical protein
LDKPFPNGYGLDRPIILSISNPIGALAFIERSF